MKGFRRTATAGLLIGLFVLSGDGVVESHCEIPCGIYGDLTRIDLMHEHVRTVEKSMEQINSLSKGDPVNYNQLVRWVSNKEEHAGEIQHIVSQYFMTQRVKPKPTADAAYAKYITQLTTLHAMLIHAMKAKQTTDPAHCHRLRELIDQFAAAYFESDDLKSIRAEHGSPDHAH